MHRIMHDNDVPKSNVKLEFVVEKIEITENDCKQQPEYEESPHAIFIKEELDDEEQTESSSFIFKELQEAETVFSPCEQLGRDPLGEVGQEFTTAQPVFVPCGKVEEDSSDETEHAEPVFSPYVEFGEDISDEAGERFDLAKPVFAGGEESGEHFLAEVAKCISGDSRNTSEPPATEGNARNLFKLNPEDLKCSFCEKTFTHKFLLDAHIKIHKVEFWCNYCNKGFENKETFYLHLLIHEGGRPFACHTCNRAFFKEQQLKTHLTFHKIGTVGKCNICNKQFSKRSKLRSHFKIHEERITLECDHCYKKFLHRSSLRRHIKRYHDIVQNPLLKVNSGECPFRCSMYNKTL